MKLETISRLEVHSSDTRLVKYAVEDVKIFLQDDDRTLKIFFTEGDPESAEEMQSELWSKAIRSLPRKDS